MLTSVNVTNAASNTLQLPLADFSGGYVVEDIEGLDPVNATLTSTVMAQVDGAQPQNAQRGTRNITMKLGLLPDFVSSTVDSLRTSLYAWFMPEMNVQLDFYKDGGWFGTTTGQVESFANSMFSTDPEVDISIICYDPDFYGPITTAGYYTTTDTSTENIQYNGTSDAGITYIMNVNATLSSFAMYLTRADGVVQKMSVNGSFIAGDIITITTNPGSRSATLNRAGIVTSIMYAIDPTSVWPMVTNGLNTFRTYSTVTGVPYTVEWQNKYGAI